MIQSPAEFQLIEIIQQEIAAGRITLTTHVAHLSPYVYLYKDQALYSVFTGVLDDNYVADYTWDIGSARGRFYPAHKIHEALQARVPYVMIHDEEIPDRKLVDSFPDSLDLHDYDLLFNSNGMRLYRAHEVI